MASLFGSPPSGKPSDIAQWVRRFLIVMTLLGGVALLGVVAWFFSRIAHALLIFIVSMLLAYVIYPLVGLLKRFLPTFVAIFLTYIVVFGLLLFFLYVVGLTAFGQLLGLVTSIQQYLPQFFGNIQPALRYLQRIGITSDDLKSSGQQILNYFLHLVGDIQPLLVNLFTLFLDSILVTTLSIYFVIDGPRFLNWLRTRTPRANRESISFFVQTLDRTMGGFIRGQLFLGTLMSGLIGLGLFFLGVPYAVLLALVVFVLEFIPQIGPYISGTIIVVVALVTRGWQIGLTVAIMSSFVQAILDGQILAPRIIGHAVGLNPIISILALLVGTDLFGLAGAFFSAPVAGILQIFVGAAYYSWKQEHPEQFAEEAPEKATESSS
ncbi:AI-2E family transporter [Tengunoibacter tsumagoiensis]|uniref:AI-2E family transporter n=1 Tax=Tengunoibacter tsumagoiensis TaxID=2014871 RepID=A0A401ZZ34_9CHLR|nr:AI-2E family transporter [Tengunoibacter tsumagoiensis]GCE12082.1 hypothetical protein KTT_19410 [Tengunoibacter tsumagoiensis]